MGDYFHGFSDPWLVVVDGSLLFLGEELGYGCVVVVLPV